MPLPLAHILARVALTGCVLMASIVMSSAYLRLTTMGVGCTDWPQCYGQVGLPEKQAAPADRSTTIAWVRIVHRLSAMGIAVLAVLLVILTVHPGGRTRRNLTLALIALVMTATLAVIGRWSAGSLVPAIGVTNLLGGFLLLVCFWLLYLCNRSPDPGAARPTASFGLTTIALALLCGQIALGAWVSVTYSAPVCRDLFDCEMPQPAGSAGATLPIFASLEVDGHGRVLPPRGANKVQSVHRISGVVLALVLAALTLPWLRSAPLRWLGATVLATAIAVPALGISLALFELPLAAALLHNALAAVLLLALVTVAYHQHKAQPLS